MKNFGNKENKLNSQISTVTLQVNGHVFSL